MTTTRLTLAKREVTEQSAGFILYATGEESKRHYLLLRHCNGGHWGFPKGRIEEGEGEEQAALREVQEETGIQKIEPVLGFRTVSTYRYVRGKTPILKEAIYFLGRARMHDPILSSEHAEWRWLNYAVAHRTLTYADTRRVLHEADQYLREEAGEESLGSLHRYSGI